jgi:hypothetical protein
MSEYQYYEWQTLDRPLTPEERAAVSRLFSAIWSSTRVAGLISRRGWLSADPIEHDDHEGWKMLVVQGGSCYTR